MTDIHCHILPGLYDGAPDYEAALEMIRIAEKEGVGCIVATPHCIDFPDEDIFGVLSNLKELASGQGCNVELLAGSEIYINPDLPRMAKDNKIISINRSRYVLVELPMLDMPLYTLDVVYELRLIGFVPVIAHPERYKYVIGNPNIVKGLIDAGALCQVNSGSITGRYGKAVEKTVHTLLRHNMVHFAASDAHSPNHRPPRLKKAYEITEECYGKDKAHKLFCGNPYAAVKNEDIEIEEPIAVKKRKWFFLK
ncbi:MAG: capsular biosynthesis protein [Clostridiaceae bacterium]|nr:capsular biosynthesis protein [Clostridiaceae bacterium]